MLVFLCLGLRDEGSVFFLFGVRDIGPWRDAALDLRPPKAYSTLGFGQIPKPPSQLGIGSKGFGFRLRASLETRIRFSKVVNNHRKGGYQVRTTAVTIATTTTPTYNNTWQQQTLSSPVATS